MNDSITYQGLHKLSGRRIKLLFYTLAFSVLAVSLLFFALSAGKPSMGIVLSLNGQEWAVQSMDSNGVASQAGIKVGDKPEVINGQAAQIFLQKYHEEGFVLGHLIQELTVRDDNGQLKTVDVNSSPSLQSSVELATWFFVSLIFWIAGLFVYFKRPENISALLFCLCGLVFGLALSANMAGERLVPVAVHISVIATAISPWLLLHFFLVLPEERTRLRNNPLIYLIYLPAAITIILHFIIGFADGQPLQDFRTVRLLGFGIGLLAVIGVVILNYVRATSLKTRQQMKIILVGCLAAIIPFLGLSVFPAATEGANVMPASFSMLFISFIPLSMGYAVITKKLMDIDIFIRRSAVYGLITVFMAAILAVAISLAPVFRESTGVLDIILVALVLGGLATVLFGPTKKWIENVIDKLFYKDRYDYRATIKELSNSLNRLNDISSASSIIASTVMNTLKLAGACLFIETEKGGFQVSAARGIFTDTIKEGQLLKVISQQRSSRIEFPNSASSVNPNIAYLVPLTVGDREIGFLFLSPKLSGQDYLPTDMYLIQDLAVVVTVSFRSMLIIANDIAGRKQLEIERERADKLESLGTLAGGIAHDFNNILTGIMGNISLTKRYLETDRIEKSKERLDEAEKASARAKDLTQQLLTFSRGGAPIKKLVSITESLKESVAFVLRGSNVRADFSMPDDLWVAEVDSGQMNQVFNNIILNAVQAMPDGGIINIRVRNIAVSELSDLPLPKGEYIEIVIEDHGVGISKEHLKRIYEPYFTTKQKGSGLGMATTHSIIKNHGGHIMVDSKIGTGTTFHIYLPATKGKLPMKKEEAIQPSIPGGWKILVMDDEEAIGELLYDELTDLGYEVKLSVNGTEAINRYTEAKESWQPFDAVILDLTIPGGIGGEEVIKKLIEIDPDVKAIVSSGYSNDPVMSDFREYGFKGVVAKPYKMENLEETLHSILEKNS